MRYKILWIEDTFQSISAVHNDLVKRQDIQITLIRTIHDFATLLMTSDLKLFDLMILDYDINGDFTITNPVFYNSIRESGKPFIIYSAFTLDVKKNHDLLNDSRLLNVFEKSSQEVEFIEFVTHLKDFCSLSICHVSDIHFDYNDSSDQKKRLEGFFNVIKKSKPDITCITGDFANHNLKKDYIELGVILKNGFLSIYGTDLNNKVFFIPGNHDVLWDDYKSGVLNNRCYNDYNSFVKSFYGYHPNNDLVRNIDTCWSRTLSPKLKIIGLNSSISLSEEPDLAEIENSKGNGYFLNSHKDLIMQNWVETKELGELRILLIHHNLFTPLSFSQYDEDSQIIKNGVMIKTILERKCDLVLSGHTHSPCIFEWNGASFNDALGEYNKYNKIINVSSGTFGGYGPHLRTNCYFNIIKVLPYRVENKILWNIEVASYVYDESNQSWHERNKFVSSLNNIIN